MAGLAQRIVGKIRRTLRPDPAPRLLLVRSGPLGDNWITGPNGHRLYTSSFNPAWLKELGVSPSVILDVGSYDGGDAVRFQRTYPNALVITIEADPARAAIVREATAGTPIKVLECAATSEDGPVDFFPTTEAGEASAQGSLFKFSQQATQDIPHIKQSEQAVRLGGRTLSGIAAEVGADSISLLHMDIQGGEYGALVGLGPLRPQVVFLEVNASYTGVPSATAIHAKMTEMGYRLAADLISDRLYVRA